MKKKKPKHLKELAIGSAVVAGTIGILLWRKHHGDHQAHEVLLDELHEQEHGKPSADDVHDKLDAHPFTHDPE